MARIDLMKLTYVRELAENGVAREIRVGAGLSLREVAGQIGVGPSTVYRWEVGARRPHGKAAVRYAALLESLSASRSLEGAPMP